MAKTYTWNFAVSGPWSAAANWIDYAAGTTGIVPGPGDDAQIGKLGGVVTVTLGGFANVQGLALGGQTMLLVDGGGLQVSGSVTDRWAFPNGVTVTGGGTVALENDGKFVLGGSAAAQIGVMFDGSSDLLVLGGVTSSGSQPGIFAGTIGGFGGEGEIALGVRYDPRDTLGYGGGALQVFGATGTELLKVSINLPAKGFAITPFTGYPGGGGQQYLGIVVACFARGTRIRTEAGEVPVELLAVGDRVVTRAGDEVARDVDVLRPIRWIGRRRVDLASHPDPLSAAPVRVGRDAFAAGVPVRDVRFSPDHAVMVDGALVPVRLLVNEHSIAVERDCRSVEYFHVELDRHSILLAEGLLAESYLDTGNRACFANAGVAMVLHPAFDVNAALCTWADDACMALTVDPAAVEPIWRRLAERAGACNVVDTDGAASPEIVLEVGGRLLSPVEIDGDRHVFALPRDARRARLLSRSASPASIRPFLDDRRALGVKVGRLVADGELVAIDGPALGQGWWSNEADGRWTDGAGELAVPPGAATLSVWVVDRLARYPTAPAWRRAA